jgi:hypothetical protein
MVGYGLFIKVPDSNEIENLRREIVFDHPELRSSAAITM